MGHRCHLETASIRIYIYIIIADMRKKEVSTVADGCHATSRFRFPISVFHSLAVALALAPIGHGNIVVDRFPSPNPSPNPSPVTYRPRYLSATVHATSRFRFPVSNFIAAEFHFPISIFRPRGIYRFDADLAAFTG